MRKTLVVSPVSSLFRKVAGNGGGIEDVLHITHHLPAGSIGQDQRKIHVRIAVNLVIEPSLNTRAQLCDCQ